MNTNFTRVEVEYTRNSGEKTYRGFARVVNVKFLGEVWEKELDRCEFQKVGMENLIKILHSYLNKYPDAKVDMIRPKGEKFLKESERDRPRAFELDVHTTQVIRDDLPRALEMFAPIKQVVQVRPTTPRLEKDDGSEE